MAQNAYLKLKGHTSGPINGSVTKKGMENNILVFAVSHQIVTAYDPHSGQPSGKRQHKALVISKELDKSTPRLFNLLCTNENVTEWNLNFYASTMGVGGGEKPRFSIQLANAKVASIDFRMPDNRTPELAKLTEYEEVAFTYQTITWTWHDGGIQAEDSWAGD